MDQRRWSFSALLQILHVHVLFTASYAWLSASTVGTRRPPPRSFDELSDLSSGYAVTDRRGLASITLQSSQRSVSTEIISETSMDSRAAAISSHLNAAQTNDINVQYTELEAAESALLQWVNEFRKSTDQDVQKPDASVFEQLISKVLALPTNHDESAIIHELNSGTDDEAMDQLRAVMKQKSTHRKQEEYESKSERATRLLDTMESFHEPPASIYDDVIGAHCIDALDYLQPSNNDAAGTIHRAWKAAKSALTLLNHSEELYRETGESNQLPSITSYVALMDVWRALAVKSEQDEDIKKREEALDIVRLLHSRRLEVYSFNGGESLNQQYNILPVETTSSVQGVLQCAIQMLQKAEPSYQLSYDAESIGTWHFNQLIFDLAKYPQPFSGPLAQDLLEFMVATVKKSSQSKNKEANPIVPKPNTDTINSVLKAWMVTPKAEDVARRAEAVLAQLAVWQAESTLSAVSPDVVSYNTVISCWKDSGIVGSAARATEILALLEANSTDIAPDVITYSSCISAWAEAAEKEKGAARRAEEILTRMHQRSKLDSSYPRPNTRCFNAVLLAYANAREAGGGKRALDLLRFMERLHSEGFADTKPDTYTLNIVVKALTNCGEAGAAEKANEILKRMEDSKDDGSLQADLISYNSVLDSFAKKGDAVAAESLLKQMYKRAHKEAGVDKPNAFSYTAVLSAWSRSDDKTKAVKRAEELVNDLEARWASGETDTRVDTSIYNALINVWAKSGDKKTLLRVTQILTLMEELGLQGGDSEVAPNSRTYCAVLDALARSKNWKAYDEALKIIDRMELLFEEGFDSVRPCTRAYSIVISTIARSHKKDKALKAQEILHRMENEYRKGNTDARPNIYSFNAVLNAAAYTPRGDEREQEEAFKIACLTFDELRMSDYLKPNHISYGTFLKAVQNHMPSSEVRDDLVKSVFRRCCRDGQVGTLVLRNMKHLASAELYQTLLEGESNFDLPKSWSINVKEPHSMTS